MDRSGGGPDLIAETDATLDAIAETASPVTSSSVENIGQLVRTGRYCHRSYGSLATQEANLDGCHGKHGAVVAAPPDERSATDALDATGSTFHARV
jgi:hypothetical protein